MRWPAAARRPSTKPRGPNSGCCWKNRNTPSARRRSASGSGAILNLLADIGETLVDVGRNMVTGVAFLGEVVNSMVKALLHPARFRGTSIVFHIESFAFRSLPIIALINFLVGCIVAQQTIFQLQKFGAATFAVDLIGILTLRELAVLLTSIMIAGRSGSAITAELGSMKMREEIDALRVMGLDPVDVLIMPRILALLISLPLLTFLADMSAIFGGLVSAGSMAASALKCSSRACRPRSR